MKIAIISTLAASTGLFLVPSDRMPDVPGPLSSASAPASPPVVTPPVAVPVGTRMEVRAPDAEEPVSSLNQAMDENAALEQEIAELKARESELRLQMQQDELALRKAELERQRDELAARKAALEAAAANRTAPPPPVTATALVYQGDTALTVPGGGRDYQMFYEGLAPYGEWMDTAEYGYVWQPAAQRNAGWRPYTMGRWADSDQGWTWISDEPFGWAAYHYGRWALLQGHGWIWVPGDTWAPAWVSWRNNAEYIGWSPLPPETIYADNTDYGPAVDDDYGISPVSYIFIPVRHFDEPVYRHCRPVAESAGFFSLTTGVTRIVIRSGSVHCGGPEPRWVNSCLLRPMTRYRIGRDHDRDARRDYRPLFEQDRLHCYSPLVRNSWNEGLRPSRVGGKWDHIKIVRRQEPVRGDFAQRFQEERNHRRERAAVSLRNDTVRKFAERHGQLEKVRARQVQLTERQPSRDSGEDRSRHGDPRRLERPEPNKHVRGGEAHELAGRQARAEAAQRELKERQQQVTRLLQQRESMEKGREESARREQVRQHEVRQRQAEEVRRGQQESQQRKEREESALREQVRQNEVRQRQAEEVRRGQQESQQRKEREESARREQVRQLEVRQRQAEEVRRGQQESQQRKEREESARREQVRQHEVRQRQAEEVRRSQQESQQRKEREESARREQVRQHEARQRQASEQQARANRDRERSENVRREQARQHDPRQNPARQHEARQQEARQRQAGEQPRRAADPRRFSPRDFKKDAGEGGGRVRGG